MVIETVLSSNSSQSICYINHSWCIIFLHYLPIFQRSLPLLLFGFLLCVYIIGPLCCVFFSILVCWRYHLSSSEGSIIIRNKINWKQLCLVMISSLVASSHWWGATQVSLAPVVITNLNPYRGDVIFVSIGLGCQSKCMLLEILM